MSGGGFLEAVRPRADAMSGPDGGWPGVHVAIVTDNQDPLGQGRVKVRLPWAPDSGDERFESWARVATLMAGPSRGTWFVPDPDDEVVVAFEGGNPFRPVVLGALWNGSDQPAEQMAEGNPKRTILTGAGVRITLDDSDGAVSLLLETPGGQRVHLEDTPATVTVEDASGNSVTLESSGVTVASAGQVTIRAGSLVSIKASMLQVQAGLSLFSGLVQCDTLLTNTVISAAYMPGAGNML